MNEKMIAQIEKVAKKVMDSRAEKLNGLFLDELVKAIEQMIDSGDFHALVNSSNDGRYVAAAVTYIPYRKDLDQKAEIARLNEIIDALVDCKNNECKCGSGGVCNQCKEMVQRHRGEIFDDYFGREYGPDGKELGLR